MAKIKPSHLVGAISGTLGTNIFKQTRNGAVVALRGRPTRAPSPAALLAHTEFQRTQNAWRDLSAALRTQWTTLARSVPRRDRLGVTRTYSGRQLFIQYNMAALACSQAISTTPPTSPRLSALADLLLDSVMTFDITYSFNLIEPASPCFLIAQGARSLTDSLGWYPHVWRTIQADSQATGVDTITITSNWEAILGQPQIGETVALRVYVWCSGYLPSPFATHVTQRSA